MRVKRGMRLFFVFCMALLLRAAAVEAQQRSDPTAPPLEMGDNLRRQLTELRALTLQALVVGADGAGVALLAPGSGAAVASQVRGRGNYLTVRAGNTLTLEVATLPVRLTIKSVTAAGVEIEAPTLAEKLLIPGGYQALAATADGPPDLLRYLECHDVPLEMLLRLIADQSGANISTSAAAAREPVSIFLRNVAVDLAVEEICRTCGLWFRRDELSGITRVTTMQEYEQNLSTFREEATEVFTLLYPNVYEVATVIYGLYPERVAITLGEEGSEDETRDISRRFERLSVISSGANSGLLNSGLGGNYGNYGGGYGGGRGFGGEFSGRNMLLQRSGDNWIDMRSRETFTKLTPEDAKQLEGLRSAAATGDVERILGSYQERKATIFVTASRRNNMLVVRSGDPVVMAEIRDLIRRLDVPTSMVLLEVKILQLILGDDFTSSFEYEFHKDFNKGSSTPIGTKGGFPGFEPLSDNIPNPQAMSFKVLSDNLNLRIQMLEGMGRAKTLATPSLLIANNEVSRLFIGEERPIIQNVSGDVVVNNDNVVVSPNVNMEYRPVGIMLLITPNINADRTVTLRLLQENASIKKGDAQIPLYSTQSSDYVPFAIDVISSRSIAGTFVAQDNMTVAAGGLIEEEESREESRVPVLGRLPLLGWLFRSTKTVKKRTELVVIIKPHVISTPSEGEEISRRVLERISIHPARDGRGALGTYAQEELEGTKK